VATAEHEGTGQVERLEQRDRMDRDGFAQDRQADEQHGKPNETCHRPARTCESRPAGRCRGGRAGQEDEADQRARTDDRHLDGR
jgi:hypothetical protein